MWAGAPKGGSPEGGLKKTQTSGAQTGGAQKGGEPKGREAETQKKWRTAKCRTAYLNSFTCFLKFTTRVNATCLPASRLHRTAQTKLRMPYAVHLLYLVRRRGKTGGEDHPVCFVFFASTAPHVALSSTPTTVSKRKTMPKAWCHTHWCNFFAPRNISKTSTQCKQSVLSRHNSPDKAIGTIGCNTTVASLSAFVPTKIICILLRKVSSVFCVFASALHSSFPLSEFHSRFSSIIQYCAASSATCFFEVITCMFSCCFAHFLFLFVGGHVCQAALPLL